MSFLTSKCPSAVDRLLLFLNFLDFWHDKFLRLFLLITKIHFETFLLRNDDVLINGSIH